MLVLAQHYFVTLLAALLIGIVTGWWAFGRRGAEPRDKGDSNRS